jgi:hypothetical protein
VCRLDGTSASDVWAAVEHPGGVFHWDGRQWTDRTAGLEGTITAVRVVGAEVLVVGDFGLVRGSVDTTWRYLHRHTGDSFSGVPFVDVCVTRTAIVLGSQRSTWTRALN